MTVDNGVERRRSEEVVIANCASRLIGPKGYVSPSVVRSGDHRPVLKHVPGSRLNDSLELFEEDAPAMMRDAVTLLAILHAAQAPVERKATFEEPPWNPVPYPFYTSMTNAQRRIVGELHSENELRLAGIRINDMALDGDIWCHGDARLDNFVLDCGIPVLIDWECSGTASPEVDIAALLASLIESALNDALRAQNDVRRKVDAVLVRCRTLVTETVVAYQAVGGQNLDTYLLGAKVGSSLISRAFARSASYSYDRVTAMLMSVGCSLVRHPERWSTLHTMENASGRG